MGLLILRNERKIVIRVLIRDHSSQFVGALSATRPLAQNLFIVESLALFMAVKFCQNIEIQHCILEGDAYFK